MPDTASLSSDALRHAVEAGAAILVTGPRGIGKTHTLRALSSALSRSGRTAPVIAGSNRSGGIPLGAFAAAGEQWHSAASVIDTFARERSARVLLVDDVDALDDASLFVVCQLVATTRVPAVLTSRSLTTAPASIQRLYDGGDLTERALAPLTDIEAKQLLTELLGASATPAARAAILAAAQGNPLHVREIVRGSVDQGRLVETAHGWDLVSAPVPSPRLSQLLGVRLDELDPRALDEAAKIAIADALPRSAVDGDALRTLVRSGVVETTGDNQVRLVDPLDVEHLRSRFAAPAWRELAREVAEQMRASGPLLARRAVPIALEHDLEVDLDAAVELAERALAALDPRLAMRAANAVLDSQPDDVRALRVAGLAASALGETTLADAHLGRALEAARDDADTSAAAIATAQHLGNHRHDPGGAVLAIDEALRVVTAPEPLAHLQRARLRWGAVAGQGASSPAEPGAAARTAPLDPPEQLDHPEAAMGLIAAGVSGVIAGPLDEATTVLHRLEQLPSEVLARVPGGRQLIDLTAIMALSYTGDILATRRRLDATIATSERDAPEELGVWEYALGVVELFSSDAERAYELARSASAHLAWRDTTGLLPAAQALAAAAALATGREIESAKAFDAISETAAIDPKVVMLRGWATAWQHHLERRPEAAARELVTTARSLLDAQHTFLAGMAAHCAARLNRRREEVVQILDVAAALGGGGLLALLARHARAVRDGDTTSLEQIAADAQELGLDVTAADTWALLADSPSRPGARARRHLAAVPTPLTRMALWTGPQDRSHVLTERERQVAELAAQRLTAKEIARRHSVSVHTVNNQLASVFRKLGISSRAELREVVEAATALSPVADPLARPARGKGHQVRAVRDERESWHEGLPQGRAARGSSHNT